MAVNLWIAATSFSHTVRLLLLVQYTRDAAWKLAYCRPNELREHKRETDNKMSCGTSRTSFCDRIGGYQVNTLFVGTKIARHIKCLSKVQAGGYTLPH